MLTTLVTIVIILLFIFYLKSTFENQKNFDIITSSNISIISIIIFFMGIVFQGTLPQKFNSTIKFKEIKTDTSETKLIFENTKDIFKRNFIIHLTESTHFKAGDSINILQLPKLSDSTNKTKSSIFNYKNLNFTLSDSDTVLIIKDNKFSLIITQYYSTNNSK